MRVVCPHTTIHPDTDGALDQAAYGFGSKVSVERVYVGHSATAYAELVCELWADGKDFLIVEHDVVPSYTDIARMLVCEEPYCAAPYAWGQAVGVALGFTRFRSLFLRTYPDAAEIARRIPTNFGTPGHWRQFDVFLQGAVLRDLYGWQPHAHPVVVHRNWEDTPADAPLRTQVEGRMYLEPGLVERIASRVADSPCEHHCRTLVSTRLSPAKTLIGQRPELAQAVVATETCAVCGAELESWVA